MKPMTFEEIFTRVKNAIKIGEYDLAETLLKRLIQEKPNLFLPYIMLGNVYHRRGRSKEAFRQFKLAIKIKKDSADVYNNMGIAQKNSSNFKEALHYLEHALHLSKNRADILYNIGNVFKEIGDYEKAIEQYKKAIGIDASFVLSYNNLGTVLERLGRYDEAREVYLKGLEYDFNNPLLRYNLGIILENRGELEEAKIQFERALKSRPGWINAMNNLGVVFGKLGKHEASCSIFKEALKIEPDNVKAINNLGIEYGKLQEIDRATECYRKAQSISPEYYKASMNLGILLEEQGYYDEALDEMEKLLAKNRDDYNARFRMGNILFSLQRYKAAEKQFLKILENVPEHPETIRALGNLYLHTNREDEANKYYEKLEKLHPQQKTYHLDLAVVLNERDEIEKSEEETKKYLSQHPDDVDAKSLLGELYFKQGDLTHASELFEEIIGKKPQIIKPYYYLAKTYKNMGKPEMAVEVVDRLINLQGKRGTVTDLNNLTETLELYEEATKAYEKKFKEGLNKAIAHLDDFEFDEGDDERLISESDSVYSPLDTANILKVGGVDKFIPVKEEEEQINIINVEQHNDNLVEIQDEEPPPFTDLLKNVELYDGIEKIKTWQEEQEELLGKLKKREVPEEIKAPLEKKEKKENSLHKDIKEEKKEDMIPDKYVPPIDKKIPPFDERDKTFKKLQESINNLTEAFKSSKSQFIPIPVFTPGQQQYNYTMDKPVEMKFFAPKRKKRRKKRKKPKSLRDELRSYIQKVQSKLEQDTPLKLPDDEKKKEDIKKLVDSMTKKPSFSIESIASNNVKEEDDGGTVEDSDKVIFSVTKKSKEEKKDDKKEKHRESVDKERDMEHAVLLSEGTTSGEEPQYTMHEEVMRSGEKEEGEITVKEEREHIDEEKNKKSDTTYRNGIKDKAFKPYIRVTKTPFTRSMIINLLYFFQRLIDFIPASHFKKKLGKKIVDLIHRMRK